MTHLGSIGEKVVQILERWNRQVPAFRYRVDSKGNIIFPFRGVLINIVFTGTLLGTPSDSINCLAIQPYYINAILPFNPRIRNILLDYSSRWFYSFLSAGSYPSRKAITICPQAVLPEEYLSFESLHHSLVEITTGYWDLTKALYTSGLLPPPPLNKAKFDEMIDRWNDPMKLGMERCSIDSILTFQGREYESLVFNNLIGDKPGTGLQMSRELFDVPDPIHHDLYRFKFQDLEKLLSPVKDVLVKCNNRFEFATLHQGFPLQFFKGHIIADYHAFLGVRFSVDVMDEKSFSKREVPEWKEALVLAFPTSDSSFLGRYALRDGRIYFNINIPFYTDANHNLLTAPLEEELIRRAVLEPERPIRKYVERYYQLGQNSQL